MPRAVFIKEPTVLFLTIRIVLARGKLPMHRFHPRWKVTSQWTLREKIPVTCPAERWSYRIERVNVLSFMFLFLVNLLKYLLLCLDT